MIGAAAVCGAYLEFLTGSDSVRDVTSSNDASARVVSVTLGSAVGLVPTHFSHQLGVSDLPRDFTTATTMTFTGRYQVGTCRVCAA